MKNTPALNATTHGITANTHLLPDECMDTFNELHQGFIDEYRPLGHTQAYLVKELAMIIWKKQRLNKAEQAVYKRSLFTSVSANDLTTKEAMLNGEKVVSALYVRQVLELTPEDIQNGLDNLKQDRKSIQQALQEKYPYDSMIKMLSKSIKQEWQNACASEYQENEDDLNQWLHIKIKDLNGTIEALKNAPIMFQYAHNKAHKALAEAVTLHRYEKHLDKRFEKTLAMLLKLKMLQA